MKSRTTALFRQAFADLPAQVQQQTRSAYRQFKQNPSHPSLRFKKIHPELPIYSARINRNYRAVGHIMSGKSLTIGVGWVEERNPTFISIWLGFAIAQPNLRFVINQPDMISIGKRYSYLVLGGFTRRI